MARHRRLGRRLAGGRVAPTRGEVWQLDFDPVRGREQGGRRPALVLSADTYNSGPSGLIVVAPLTTRDKRVPLHVRIEPPEGGLARTSFVKIDDVRAVAKTRLGRRLGSVTPATLESAEASLRILLDL